MNIAESTILITGGGSGIGRGLAEAFAQAGATVIIAGRRQNALDEVTRANPKIKSVVFDINDAGSIKSFAEQLVKGYPKLNAVMHNAGVMKNEALRDGKTDDAEATIATNLLGPIRLNSALLPHLLQQPAATVLTVTSGLAFVPLTMTPTYCATKAAIHSYTQSLRYQLKDGPVQVIEIVPPYVQTELMGDRQKNDPAAMPLDEFVTQVMDLLQKEPEAHEILVDRVKPLRYAASNGDYEGFFTRFNDTMKAARPNG